MIPSPPALKHARQFATALSCALAPLEQAASVLGHVKEDALGLLRCACFEPRLVARFGEDRLRRSLDEDAADAMVVSYRKACAKQVYFVTAAKQVADIAAARRIPLMFMKGMALLLGGYIEAGRRAFGDIDVLVPEDRAKELWDVCVAEGFRPCGAELEPDHPHLEALVLPMGGGLDIHRRMPGFEHGTGIRGVDIDELIGSGACVAAPGMPEGCWIPRLDLLTASLLAHNFGKHFLGAHAGIFGVRLLADLVDLRPLIRVTQPEVGTWLSHQVEPELIAAADEIVECCFRGDDLVDSVLGARSDAGRLLSHFVVLLTDDNYRHFITLRQATEGFQVTGWWHKLYRPWSELRAKLGSRSAALRWYLERTAHLAAVAGNGTLAWLRLNCQRRLKKSP